MRKSKQQLIRVLTQGIKEDILSFTDELAVAQRVSQMAGRKNPFDYSDREMVADKCKRLGITNA